MLCHDERPNLGGMGHASKARLEGACVTSQDATILLELLGLRRAREGVPPRLWAGWVERWLAKLFSILEGPARGSPPRLWVVKSGCTNLLDFLHG